MGLKRETVSDYDITRDLFDTFVELGRDLLATISKIGYWKASGSLGPLSTEYQ